MSLTKIYCVTKIERKKRKKKEKGKNIGRVSNVCYPTVGRNPINPSPPYRQSRIHFNWFRISDQLAHILVNRGYEIRPFFHPSVRFTQVLNRFLVAGFCPL